MSDSKRKRVLLTRAYEIIGRLTPIRADCGGLCDAACCKDGENGDEKGMLLFPGEEERFFGMDGFKVSRVEFDGRPAFFLTCQGRCDRSFRPLSCRIYPLAPKITEDGHLTVGEDPRAKPVCPLYGGGHIDRRFSAAVERALAALWVDDEMRAFICAISSVTEDYRRFLG